jgi:Methyltransferase FkbM domain
MNCETFGFNQVELIRKAVWTETGKFPFWQEGGDAGRLATTSTDTQTLMVETCRLKDYLNEPIDFLKLDIEGAEVAILPDCVRELAKVQHCFVEYHSFTDRSQGLEVVTGALSEAGFRLHIHPVFWSHFPFLARREHLGMDLQLNIFAFRL